MTSQRLNSVVVLNVQRDLTDELDIPAMADEFVRGNGVRKDIFGWLDVLTWLCVTLSLTSTWPHLRCDVGLEEGEYWKKKLSRTCSIVYYYNGAQIYEQFLQVSWLYRALILLGLALSLVFMVLYIIFFAYILLFTF